MRQNRHLKLGGLSGSGSGIGAIGQIQSIGGGAEIEGNVAFGPVISGVCYAR